MTLVALIVSTGAAAALGNAPENPGANEANETDIDEEPSENTSDDVSTAGDQSVEPNENASGAMYQSGEPNKNASANVGGVSSIDAQGPPANLPDHVPELVKQIHDLIRDFPKGEINRPLGEAIQHL